MTPSKVWDELSVQQVALALGKSRMGVHNWKTARHGIPAEMCKAISKEFGIPLAELRPDLWGAE